MAKAGKGPQPGIPCEECQAGAGENCTDEYGAAIGTHQVRRRQWRRIVRTSTNK